jgi:hypothetical protein
MKWFTLFLSLSIHSLSSNNVPGTTDSELIKLDRRIIGGKTVDPPFKYPYMATLMRYDYYQCGAALIGDKYVLTAAHCMISDKAPLKNFKIHLHRQNWALDPVEENAFVYTISEKIIHPGYNSTTLDHDCKLNYITYPMTMLIFMFYSGHSSIKYNETRYNTSNTSR